MKLWTIQSPEVYNEIQTKGVFRCDPALSDNQEDEFRRAYTWLRGKMEEKVGPAPEDVTDPVWAWHTWEGNRKKPDFRSTMFRYHPDCYLLEVEIPDEQVMLTDFDDWHFVLNGWLLPTEEDADLSDENDDWWSLPEAERIQTAEASWDKLVNRSEEELAKRESATVQATFWELKKEQVKKAWFFKERK